MTRRTCATCGLLALVMEGVAVWIVVWFIEAFPRWADFVQTQASTFFDYAGAGVWLLGACVLFGVVLIGAAVVVSFLWCAATGRPLPFWLIGPPSPRSHNEDTYR